VVRQLSERDSERDVQRSGLLVLEMEGSAHRWGTRLVGKRNIFVGDG